MPVLRGWRQLSGQIVNSFRHFQKVHLSESRNFTTYDCGKLTYVENRETYHLDHLQHDSYVDISY